MNAVAGEGAALLNDPLNTEEYKTLIMQIIHDISFRNEIIMAGIENAKKYTVEKAVKNIQIYTMNL
jgi:hypothetical protein